ncbi:hypothetical protein WJX82_003985 [Trebouxia sp. C0006]
MMSSMSRGRQDAAFESKEVDGSRPGSHGRLSTFCSAFLSVVDCNRCNLDAQCKQSHPSPLVQEGCRTCRLVPLWADEDCISLHILAGFVPDACQEAKSACSTLM